MGLGASNRWADAFAERTRPAIARRGRDRATAWDDTARPERIMIEAGSLVRADARLAGLGLPH